MRMTKNNEYYLSTFGVTREDMRQLTSEALRHGGDWCDLFFENTINGNLVLRDGIVSDGGFNVDYGVGIRVLNGEKTGYAYSESTDMRSMMNAAKAASAIAAGSKNMATVNAGAKSMLASHDRYPIQKSWDSVEAKAFLEKLQEKISAKDKRIVKILAGVFYTVTDVLMYNSLDEVSSDTRPYGTAYASAVFMQDGQLETKSISRSYMRGSEMLTEALADEIASETVRGIDDRFAAKRPKGGQMPVVMGAGASGILLHEAMGHAFEADFNRKGQSIFSDKMGQKVCDESITIVDDGTIPGNRGAVNFDDEGVPGQRTLMVTDGVLTSYLHDRISAKFYGVEPTGNGRREGFRFNPIPRMRATYMESGNARKEDIIASVKNGIYVDDFTNGQVKIGEGDFTFFVNSGYLIENGKLTQPIKDINVIGNGPKALADIIAVGNDLKIDEGAWTCGKGQSCPVSCGIPTVLVKNLTVGGE
jgi:TldD protein